jgi:hypothetical protein
MNNQFQSEKENVKVIASQCKSYKTMTKRCQLSASEESSFYFCKLSAFPFFFFSGDKRLKLDEKNLKSSTHPLTATLTF